MNLVRKPRAYLNLGKLLVIVQINNISIYKSSLALIKSQQNSCIRSRDIKIRKARDRKFYFQSHSNDFSVTHQNMVFQDTVEQEHYTEPVQNQDGTFKVQDGASASLADYLSRPVLIASVPWEVGLSVNTTLDPWTLFYDNVRVQKKVEGFYLQRFDLKIKILINGSPFYYGKCLASYNPLGQHDAIEVLNSASVWKLITRSQRNHVVLDANSSVGGVISCPYFNPNAYQDITYAFRDMGVLNLDSYTLLNNSNGATSTVYIQVYCWAENVVLSIPTTKSHIPLTLESHSDEYTGKHRENKKSNALMSLDKKASKAIPKITQYAMATAQCIEAVSGLALMLGFSRPPVLENQKFIKNTIYGNLANADAPECLHKLTLDSKQEITIDPRTAGIEPIDELQLSNILSRESYLTSFQWNSTTSTGDCIFSSRVTPVQFEYEVLQTGVTRVVPTMLSYASQLFEYWTGDMEYRFSVVASTYHKGRLLITFDPYPTSGVGLPESNAVYSRIIDISEVKDFVVKVSYSQPTPYMVINTIVDQCEIVFPSVNTFYAGTSPISGVPNQILGTNGILNVYVLNPLLNPSAEDTGFPEVLVYTKACDNFRFAGLRRLNANVGTVLPNAALTLESHSLESPVEKIVTTTLSNVQDSDPYPIVWFGETFTTLRTLLKRYNYYMSYAPASGVWGSIPVVQNYAQAWTLVRSNIPQYIGYDYGGFAGSGSSTFYPGKVTSLSYIMPMFVGARGSMRYKYGLSSLGTNQQTGTMSVSRHDYDVGTYYSSIQGITTTNVVDIAQRLATLPPTSSGTTTTDVNIQPVIEVELPYYSTNRFDYVRGSAEGAYSYINPANAIYAKPQCHRVDVTIPPSNNAGDNLTTLDSYVSVGEDFQLFWLLNAPPVYANTRYDD